MNPDVRLLQEEGQPVDRRMDHDLARLVQELIGNRLAVAEWSKIIQAALVGLGRAGVLLIKTPRRGVRIRKHPASMDHAVLRRPIKIVEDDRGAWISESLAFRSLRRDGSRQPG